MRRFLAAAGVAGLVGAGLAAAGAALASGYESPAYTVVRSGEDWEERAYQPSIEARVTVRGEFVPAMQDGFRLLAGYIFGGNTPIAAGGAPAVSATRSGGEQIAMTVPVAASPTGEDQWTVAFTMPSAWTLETLPRPRDPRVSLVEVPGGRWAARAFRGRMHDSMADEEIAALERAVAEAGLQVAGPAVIAQYTPPWLPGALRRNEVLVPLAEPEGERECAEGC